MSPLSAAASGLASALAGSGRGTAAGATPTRRAKARRIVSGVPKPQRAEISSTGSRALLEQLAGALDPELLDVGGRRHADLAAEEAGEVARAHRGALGERLDAQVGVEVVGDPGLQLAQRAALGELRREVGAELGLAAGALEEEDQPAGDLDGDLAAEVLLDQRQGEVHAGGDAGRGPDVAVADEDRVGVDGELGVAAGELGRSTPSGW